MYATECIIQYSIALTHYSVIHSNTHSTLASLARLATAQRHRLSRAREWGDASRIAGANIHICRVRHGDAHACGGVDGHGHVRGGWGDSSVDADQPGVVAVR